MYEAHDQAIYRVSAGGRDLRLTFAVSVATLACGGEADPPRIAGYGASRCAPACVIAFDTIWTSDPTYPDLTITHVVERADSVVAVNMTEDEYLAIVGPSGATARVVGRDGDGPGEYRSISTIDAHPDGGIYVFERRRLTVLDRELEVVSTAQWPMIVDQGVVLDDGTVVVDGRVPGEMRQSIRDQPSWMAWTPPELTANQRACNRGDLAACDRAHDEQRPPRQPLPLILDMWESADSGLWIVSVKSDARWREATAGDRQTRFDSVLEARDAVTGALLASTVLDQYVTGFTDRGGVVMPELDALDQPRHMILRVSLRRGC